MLWLKLAGMQLYNEEVNDLLAPENNKLQVWPSPFVCASPGSRRQVQRLPDGLSQQGWLSSGAPQLPESRLCQGRPPGRCQGGACMSTKSCAEQPVSCCDAEVQQGGRVRAGPAAQHSCPGACAMDKCRC